MTEHHPAMDEDERNVAADYAKDNDVRQEVETKRMREGERKQDRHWERQQARRKGHGQASDSKGKGNNAKGSGKGKANKGKLVPRPPSMPPTVDQATAGMALALAIGHGVADQDVSGPVATVPVAALRRLQESAGRAHRATTAAAQLAQTQSQQFQAEASIMLGASMTVEEVLRNAASS